MVSNKYCFNSYSGSSKEIAGQIYKHMLNNNYKNQFHYSHPKKVEHFRYYDLDCFEIEIFNNKVFCYFHPSDITGDNTFKTWFIGTYPFVINVTKHLQKYFDLKIFS